MLADSGEGPFLRTGDLGFLQAGNLVVTGREDLIIIRGRNLYPQDIERTAARCAGSLRRGGGAAFGVSIDGQERLVIVHEIEPRSRPDLPRLFHDVRFAVADEHEVEIHHIVLIKAGTLPKTSSGKIQRQAARARYLEGALATLHEDLRPAGLI